MTILTISTILNLCKNHNIDPHMVISHIDGWKVKLNIIKMEDLYDSS
jgi:hypothetical protein